MKAERLTSTAMAKTMGTTRAESDRVLDPVNPSAALATLVRTSG